MAEFQVIMMSERSQTQKNIDCKAEWFHLYEIPEKAKQTHRYRKQSSGCLTDTWTDMGIDCKGHKLWGNENAPYLE
jgi:hypothetical protein